MRQKRRSTMVAALAATLELESYLIQCSAQGDGAGVQPGTTQGNAVASVEPDLTLMIENLLEKLSRLEKKVEDAESSRYQPRRQRKRKRQPQAIMCHVCKQPGHYARGCASSIPVDPENKAMTTSEMQTQRNKDANNADPTVDNDVTPTISINSVSKYSVPVHVYGHRYHF